MVTTKHTRTPRLHRSRQRVLMAGLLAGSMVGAGAVGMTPASAAPASVPPSVTLGTAAPFSVLAHTALTNTEVTVLSGDAGVSPSGAVSGFSTVVMPHDPHVNDAVAQQARADLKSAYDDVAGRSSDADLTGKDLGGMTLTPGVRSFSSSAALTGTLTLDAEGHPERYFLFQVGSSLDANVGSTVQLANGAQACHVYWQVGSSATIFTSSTFAGNVLASESITAQDAASVDGRLLAHNGAVTLDSNTVTGGNCAPPEVLVTKTATPASRPAPGGAFTYAVTVQNTGGSPVTLSTLTDSVYGDLDGRGTCDTAGVIAAGDSYTCSFSGTFTGVAGATETDVVTAVATDGDGLEATDDDDATVTITGSAPVPGSIAVDKTASPLSRPAPGGAFTFSVTVRNTGPTPVVLTRLVDSVYGDLDGNGTCATGDTIAAGGSYSCTFTGVFTGRAGATETDVVTATAADGESELSATDDATVRLTVAVPPTSYGYLEICKKADNANGRVTGTYRFDVAGRRVAVPVGTCTAPLKVPAGLLTVTEIASPGTTMSACLTRPVAALRGCDPAKRQSTVRITAGGLANETILTVTNRVRADWTKGAIKVCKIAGPGVAVGTDFGFTVGRTKVTVPAGPASQGGYCKILGGFPRGTDVVVTETARAGTRVSAIAVQPLAHKVSASTAKRTATVGVRAGITVVSFTNTTSQP